MTPAEAAIWAAAYGAAFAAEQRELERANDDAPPNVRASVACSGVNVFRCFRVADAALERLRQEAPNHPALVPERDEPAPHSSPV